MNQNNSGIISDYLLMEFDKLHQRAALQEQAITNKVNFFLVAVTAVIGGIFVVGSNLGAIPHFWLLTSIVLILMFIIGLSTFLQVLDLTANATFYYRRAGRIRRWFVDLEPSVVKYMAFAPSDDQPPFLPRRGFLRGVESVLVLLNALLAASFSASLSLEYIKLNLTKILIIFGAVFVGIWLLQAFYVRYFLHKMDVVAAMRKYQVLYPNEKSKHYFSTLLEKYLEDNNN